MEITWYGTASLKIESEGSAVFLDPYISRNAALPPIVSSDLENINALLLTHGHFDHVADIPSLFYNRQVPVYASDKIIKTLSKCKEYVSINFNSALPGKPYKVGKLLVTPFQAKHVKFDIPLIVKTVWRIFKSLAFNIKPLAGVISDFFKYPEGETFAWQVKSEKGSVLIFGSMGFADGVQYPEPDLLVLPLQGHSRIFNMALEAVSRIKPSAVMLDHFDDSFPPVSDTIDVNAFVDLLKEEFPDVKAFVPCHRNKIKVF